MELDGELEILELIEVDGETEEDGDVEIEEEMEVEIELEIELEIEEEIELEIDEEIEETTAALTSITVIFQGAEALIVQSIV